MDKKYGWYRYQHLFQEMLRQRLHAQTSVDEVAGLYRRACEWLARHGYVQEALRHVPEAKDIDAAPGALR